MSDSAEQQEQVQQQVQSITLGTNRLQAWSRRVSRGDKERRCGGGQTGRGSSPYSAVVQGSDQQLVGEYGAIRRMKLRERPDYIAYWSLAMGVRVVGIAWPLGDGANGPDLAGPRWREVGLFLVVLCSVAHFLSFFIRIPPMHYIYAVFCQKIWVFI